MRALLRWLRGDGPLWRIGVVITAMLVLAAAIAVAATIVGAQVLDIHGTKTEPLSATTLYDLLKIAFAVAAGIGGVIALVTAYRRQRYIEIAEHRASREEQLAARAEEREATRLFNERFTTAAGQLGDDKPAVRLAGVYAMTGLADDWPDQRQTCVDVLCAYLRMPYQPDPGPDAAAEARQAFRAVREVRHTVIRVITAHLQPDDQRAATARDWRGLDFDFTGTIFDGGNFERARFTGGTVSFIDAQFTGGTVSFYGAHFADGTVRFDAAQFTGGTVKFINAHFPSGLIGFYGARFTGGTVNFEGTYFAGGVVGFDAAQFTGSTVRFDRAQFTGGLVSFYGAYFAGSTVRFDRAQFAGGVVHFRRARFTGGTVNFERVADWHAPPQFGRPPSELLPVVRMPADRTAD